MFSFVSSAEASYFDVVPLVYFCLSCLCKIFLTILSESLGLISDRNRTGKKRGGASDKAKQLLATGKNLRVFQERNCNFIHCVSAGPDTVTAA